MKPFLCAVAATILAGCGMSPERQAILANLNKQIPTCETQQECDVKWSAARQWILNNAGWKLHHAQPDFMETYNPVGASTDIAVRVVKDVKQDGKTYIVARIWCGNAFGCHPDVLDALRSFQDTVNNSWKPKP